jgi:DNA modification methylase
MRQLLRDRTPGFHCIYADPDYNVGVSYNGSASRLPFQKYVEWCEDWARLSHRLLREDGNFFIMNYPRNNAYLWVNCLDELFYEVQEYVWTYNTNIGHSPRRFTTAHRTILHCRKSKESRWFKEHIAEEYKNPDDRRIRHLRANGAKGRMPYSWFYANLVKNVSREKTEHACQIPEQLSRKLFAACTEPGDTVLIPFGGSGSEVITAIRLGLRYTVFEKEPKYSGLIKERAVEAESEVLTRQIGSRLTDYIEPRLEVQKA